MSKSNLICYTKISPNKTSPRKNKIRKITIHHAVGDISVESLGNLFANPKYQVASNYGIGSDGRIALYVDESDRAWTSANPENDHQAVNIEVANCTGEPDWKISEKAMKSLVNLCVDICKRNDIEKLVWTGDKTGNLTVHRFFRATLCPGTYLMKKMPWIAEQVNQRLTGVPFRMKATEKLLIRKDPDRNSPCVLVADIGVYTIIETGTVNGEKWGKLKSGAGWIYLGKDG